MSEYNFDEVINRHDTGSVKWGKYDGTDILPMWVADTDFKAPPVVLQALQDRVTHGIMGYSMVPEGLISVFQHYLKSHFNWDVEAEAIILLPGLVCGLNLACRAVFHMSKEVFIPTPIYPPFRSALAYNAQIAVPLEMIHQDQRPVFDFDKLESILQVRTEEAKQTAQLLLFCNPHNPGGTVYSQDELQRLQLLAEKNNLVICSDEIHCDLILSEGVKHIPLASLGGDIAKRTITLMAPSKTFNIAGLGCSMAIIQDQHLRRAFQRARRGVVPDVNIMSLDATEAAYRGGMDWLAAQLVYLRRNYDLCLERINQMPGLSLPEFDATYLAWIDATEIGLEDPVGFFEAHGIGLSHGGPFGNPKFIRLNFGCTYDQLTKALDRMHSALAVTRP